jgi:hypothetical protein
MNSSEILKIIADDLTANPNFTNSHGVDPNRCAVAPSRLRCEDSFRDGALTDLWLVLEECPGRRDGYLVVFDEERLEFGLAVYGKEQPVFIGYYGSFTETLSGM